MGIEQHYQNPTSGTTTFDTTLDAVRLGDDGAVEDGQLGAAATTSVDIDDLDGSAVYLPWQRYYLLETSCPASGVLTGTVAKDPASTTITGSGSAFLAELAPGDELVVPGGGGTEYLIVASVTDNTHAELFAAPAHTASGQTGTRAAQQRLFSGWTGPDYAIARGFGKSDGGEFIAGGRVWTLDLAEGNTALHFRIGRSAAWKKAGAVGSATNWGDRLVAILATTEVTGRLFDDGLIDYPTTACDAADVNNQYLDEVLNSMAQASGYNFSADYHEATGHWQLIVKKPAAFYLPSPLKISNYASDDGVALLVRPSGDDAVLNGAGGAIFGGIQVVGAAKSAYRVNAAVADTFEFRDTNASDSSLKTLAAIDAYGDRQLVDGATPDEKVTVSIVIPVDEAHLVRRLHQIEVRFQHLRNWTTWRWARILRRELRHAVAENGEPVPGFYEVTLVVGPTGSPPPPPTYTFAVLDHSEVPINFIGQGDYEMVHAGTGDVPPVGSAYSIQPKVNLISYLSASPYGSSKPVGFTSGGAGILRAQAEVQPEISYDFGSLPGTTAWLEVRVNGSTIVSSPVATDAGSGPHAFTPTLVLDGNVTVANGDTVILYFILRSLYISAGSVIPIAGTFAPPYQLIVEGLLS